jgi:hypothetical protein
MQYEMDRQLNLQTSQEDEELIQHLLTQVERLWNDLQDAEGKITKCKGEDAQYEYKKKALNAKSGTL